MSDNPPLDDPPPDILVPDVPIPDPPPILDVVVRKVWGDYALGDRIDDPALIADALLNRPESVVQIRWISGSPTPMPDDPIEDLTNG